MFNEKVFYQTVAKYYEEKDFEGAKKYLESQEKEVKFSAAPSFTDMN